MLCKFHKKIRNIAVANLLAISDSWHCNHISDFEIKYFSDFDHSVVLPKYK